MPDEVCRLPETVAAATSELVRATDERTLFDRVASLLATVSGVELAWIGLRDPGGRGLDRAAIRGNASVDASVLKRLDPNPSQQARLLKHMNDGHPWVVDVQGRDAEAESVGLLTARELGLGACGLFPLKGGRIPYGLLIVGARAAPFFDTSAVGMLARLGQDIAIKLDLVNRRASDAVTERELRIFTRSPDAILVVRGTTVELNPTFGVLFGTDVSSPVRGEDLRRFFAASMVDQMIELHRRRRAGAAAPAQYHAVGVRADGRHFPILVRAVPLSGADYAVFITDLSRVLG